MIRFDGQDVTETDKARIIDLLKHRGEVTSRLVDRGILMVFGGEMDLNTTTYATVDADVYSSNQSFTTNFIRNGPISFNELNADFAVALWDLNQKTLFCARDILGVKPLYYVYQPERFVAFASEIKALLALREVITRPNEHKFREYLTWATDYVPYGAETFYENIYSVLPGHYIQVSSQAVQVHAYWHIDLKKYSGLSRSEDYSTLFHDLFTEAVDRRIGEKKNVGSHLSGGLDSSSVSCVAQALLSHQQRPTIHTFNIDTEQPSADEKEYVRAVVEQWHPHHHTVRPLADIVDSVLKINHLFDRPEHFIIPSSFHLSVSLEAQQAGCDILLTGHDGDSVIPTGFDFIDELVDATDWEGLKIACQQFIDLPGRNLLYVSENWSELSKDAKFEKYALYIIGTNMKKRFREQSIPNFSAMLLKQKRIFGLSSSAIFAYFFKRIRDRLSPNRFINNALSEDFKQRVPERAQRTTKALAATWAEGQHKPLNEILNSTNVLCNEQMNHIGAYYGHQYSFPFFDKNVVELGLATPLAVHFDKGRGRGLIRNGLRDILPPTIVSRLTKANFVEYGTLSAKQLYEATHEQFAAPSHPIWAVIDRTLFLRIVHIVFDQRIPVRRKTRYNWLLSRIIYLALWLGSLPKEV
ncbi:asparagine synthetase B family protein [Spirosoma flavum]|uniref:asparagine synthase (glutamine-hydrolyzing) n=1 Tax=Spirosoma flavum TaxID=2048557 RepID=A0ABW6AH78_9BACT